ncbi:transcription factor HES-1-A-like [Dreissena polymorpha]|uniref:transcription factor HES-1-A-like n=1 Tax=Dreissena polymorpha TaxID=45954 RepID=UPI002264933A|nr:transcription factor HES-1-A-like [Dreissena polymorpha]
MAQQKQAGQEDSSYLRKIRKPLVEKQRRERMNHSIDQLKRLIADTVREQTSPMTRVDKADILDLTVSHLQQLQQRHRSVSMATESAAYNSGFQTCTREIRKPLLEKQRSKRMNHSIDQLKRLITDTIREQTRQTLWISQCSTFSSFNNATVQFPWKLSRPHTNPVSKLVQGR